MSALAHAEAALRHAPQRWLVTGAAGFIGSHLAERLLALGQRVVGLDNFSTGFQANLDAACAGAEAVYPGAATRFSFVEADLRDPDACRAVCREADYVLHQAASGSVPRSLAEPLMTHQINETGFLNMLLAAREAGVRRFVYASSSAVYGDEPTLPKQEDRIGAPLSPYAAGKRMNELYAHVFTLDGRLEAVGLRYFNVFGPRQNPGGPYAAVIPLWIRSVVAGAPCYINGDGETSRDFCFVGNVVQANLLAALSPRAAGVYNIAAGGRTTLNELHALIAARLAEQSPGLQPPPPVYRDFREGDIRHSLADISRAAADLGYAPVYSAAEGMRETVRWYAAQTA